MRAPFEVEIGSSKEGEGVRQRVAELSRVKLARVGSEVRDSLDGCCVGGEDGGLGGRMVVEGILREAGRSAS